MGRVVEKPVVYQGEITKRSMMFLSLTFDHRVIDGAPAAAFLHTLKSHLEDPGGWWRLCPERSISAILTRITCFWSCCKSLKARSLKRWILPVAVFGNSAMHSIQRGYL